MISRRTSNAILVSLTLCLCTAAHAQPSPPVLTKSFDDATIQLNASTTLRFGLSNGNPVPLTGIGFNDPLPAQLQATAPLGATPACGGTFTVTATAVTLSGASLDPNATCTLPPVTVKGVQSGQANNVTSTVSSNEVPPGAPATATTTVVRPPSPTLTKTFDDPTIQLNGSTTLRLVLLNTQPGAGALTGVNFNDPLPAQLQATATLGTTPACGGIFTVTTTAISLSGATLAPIASCTLPPVTVQGVQPGQANNVTSTVTSNEALPGNAATATTTVIRPAPPTLTKSFADPTIQVNGSTTLQFVLSNTQPGAGTLTGVTFSDTLPAQLQGTASLGATPACGGTFTVTATSVTLAGANLAANATCTLPLVSVKGVQPGQANNVTSTVTSNESLPGNVATATTTVIRPAPPTLSKAFDAPAIQLNASTVLRLVLSNTQPGAGALTAIGFNDPLPSQLQATAPVAPTPACGGTFSVTATAITLSGATLAPNATCTLPPVTVKGVQPGPANNVTSTVTSNEALPGNAATATTTVLGPPILSKSFADPVLTFSPATTLTFQITNPNPSASLSGIAFTDTLPAGLIVSTPNGLSGSCDGGSISAPAGSSVISLTGATLAPGAACVFSISVTGLIGADGPQVNTTSTITSVEGGTGGAASATVNNQQYIYFLWSFS